MSDTVKITKKDRFASIKALCEAIGAMDGFDIAGIMEFCDKEVALLDARAEKSKERAAQKRAEGDELQAAVYAVLTDEPMTRDQVFEALGDTDASIAKVGFRLNALAEAGKANKVTVSVVNEAGKTSKKVAYSLA